MERPAPNHRESEVSVFIMLLLLLSSLLIVSSNLGLVSSAQSEGGMEQAAKWLVSQHEFANLVLTPDSSIQQWKGAHMLSIVQTDGTRLNLMSVHNNTYVVILVQRELNTSLDTAGVALTFNSSSVVWAWIGGQQILVNDHHVKSQAALNNGILTVVFGRPLSAEGAGIGFKDEQPYSDLCRVTTWSNGSSLSSISFDSAPTFGFELLPYINSYPTAPLLYSTVILVAGLGFIFLELRKHH